MARAIEIVDQNLILILPRITRMELYICCLKWYGSLHIW